MLDEDTEPAEAAGAETAPAPPDESRKRQTRAAIVTTAAVGIALGIAYFPSVFTGVQYYDDEGAHLAIMKQFVQHGSLYHHTGSAYGPFLFSFVGVLYRLTGQLPTLTNGRFLVVAITVIETGLLGATVFKVTRNIFCCVLCQVAGFFLLVPVAGAQSLHPGPILVLFLSIMAYALASYAVDQRKVMLIVIGVADGALLLTKLNVGVLAATAIVAAWIVGNDRFGKTLQFVAGAGAALAVPFVLVSQRFGQTHSVAFAALVSISLLAAGATAVTDRVSLPRRGLVSMLWGLIGVGVVSIIWPLLTGTSPTDLARAVLLAPLGQVDHLARASNLAYVHFQWVLVLVTLVVAAAALTCEPEGEPKLFGSTVLPHLALAVAGLWIFGLVLLGGFAAWLPLIAILPALAWLSGAPPSTRLALRFLTALAILQILHAYPVQGVEAAWGTALAFVPCAIALATGLERLDAWRRLRTSARVIGLLALCAVFGLALGLWPVSLWNMYRDSTPLDLPSARLIRVTPGQAASLRGIAAQIRAHCDTFYSAPGLDSLYFFTGERPPTGMLRNWPGAHTAAEQRQIVERLAAEQAAGRRVCIVRDDRRQVDWLKSSYGKGPLGAALAQYRRQVALVSPYSLSVRGAPLAGQAAAARFVPAAGAHADRQGP